MHERSLNNQLVGGLEHDFLFFHILEIIIPTDELIFLRGVGIPPARQFLMNVTCRNWRVLNGSLSAG